MGGCDGRVDRIRHAAFARLSQLDQHRQVGPVKDAPVFWAAGAQGEVGRRSTKHIGHDHHAIAGIDSVGRIADFVLFCGPVIFGRDGDAAHARLVADHMFDGG